MMDFSTQQDKPYFGPLDEEEILLPYSGEKSSLENEKDPLELEGISIKTEIKVEINEEIEFHSSDDEDNIDNEINLPDNGVLNEKCNVKAEIPFNDAIEGLEQNSFSIIGDEKSNSESGNKMPSISFTESSGEKLIDVNNQPSSIDVNKHNSSGTGVTLRGKVNDKGKYVGAKRKTISLEVKLKVLKKHDSGLRNIDIANNLGLNESTVRSILKNKDIILAAAEKAVPSQATRLLRIRPPIMVEMERLLKIFIDDNTRRGIPSTILIMRHRAASLYSDLKNNYPGENIEPFNASKGWFERFKIRAKLNNIVVKDAGDVVEAENFKKTLKALKEENGYSMQQIIKIDETGLFWKEMLRRALIFQKGNNRSGFKASKDHLTLLFGGNLAGDFKLKPLLIYTSENPGALNYVDKSNLPVHWAFGPKAWMTQQIFVNWFKYYFGPAVEKFCKEKNLEYKAVLLMPNCPGHPSVEDLTAINPNIKVVNLPPNIASLIQPFDRGMIAMFKTYYLKEIFLKALASANEKNHSCKLHDFWKEYDLGKAINNISCAWNNVTAMSLNVWRNIFEDGSSNLHVETKDVMEEIVHLGKQLGLDNLNESAVSELINCDRHPLTNDELINWGKEMNTCSVQSEREEQEEDDAAGNSKVSISRSLSAAGLNKALANLKDFCDYVRENDPDERRSARVISMLERKVECYKIIRDELTECNVQTRSKSFSKKPRLS